MSATKQTSRAAIAIALLLLASACTLGTVPFFDSGFRVKPTIGPVAPNVWEDGYHAYFDFQLSGLQNRSVPVRVLSYYTPTYEAYRQGGCSGVRPVEAYSLGQTAVILPYEHTKLAGRVFIPKRRFLLMHPSCPWEGNVYVVSPGDPNVYLSWRTISLQKFFETDPSLPPRGSWSVVNMRDAYSQSVGSSGSEVTFKLRIVDAKDKQCELRASVHEVTWDAEHVPILGPVHVTISGFPERVRPGFDDTDYQAISFFVPYRPREDQPFILHKPLVLRPEVLCEGGRREAGNVYVRLDPRGPLEQARETGEALLRQLDTMLREVRDIAGGLDAR